MKRPAEPSGQTYTVRAGSDGEALVISPSGQMEFMGFWAFLRFTLAAMWAGHKIEVQDD